MGKCYEVFILARLLEGEIRSLATDREVSRPPMSLEFARNTHLQGRGHPELNVLASSHLIQRILAG